MPKCNRELIKTMESDIDISQMDSEYDKPLGECDNILPNADMVDFKTRKDQLHFYEKNSFEPCDDLWFISNEEALWQCIVGEIKTPYGDLRNSIGQATYGCHIWEMIGEPVDSLNIKTYESYIIETCLKYPEVNNVIDIETKIGDRNAYLTKITIDSIYGVFDGITHIPHANPTKRNWVTFDTLAHTSR